MGMTTVEKILAKHARLDSVTPGQLIEAQVDLVLANDITAPIAIREFREAGAKKVFDREKIVLVPDHFTPNKDIASAEQCRILREFAAEQNLKYYFEIGEMGIEHALLPEKGLVASYRTDTEQSFASELFATRSSRNVQVAPMPMPSIPVARYCQEFCVVCT